MKEEKAVESSLSKQFCNHQWALINDKESLCKEGSILWFHCMLCLSMRKKVVAED